MTDIIRDLQRLSDKISRWKVEILLKIFKHNEKCIKDRRKRYSEIEEKEKQLLNEVSREEMNGLIKQQYRKFTICMINKKEDRLKDINNIIFEDITLKLVIVDSAKWYIDQFVAIKCQHMLNQFA